MTTDEDAERVWQAMEILLYEAYEGTRGLRGGKQPYGAGKYDGIIAAMKVACAAMGHNPSNSGRTCLRCLMCLEEELT